LGGDVPASQLVDLCFDANAKRPIRDVGWMVANANESAVYTNFASEPDPVADDYAMIFEYLWRVNRYKNYNGVEGTADINNANRGFVYGT
jgi:hypothetical protein